MKSLFFICHWNDVIQSAITSFRLLNSNSHICYNVLIYQVSMATQNEKLEAILIYF